MSEGNPTPAKRPRYILRSGIKNGQFVADDIEPLEYDEPRKRKRNGGMKLLDLDDDCLLIILEYMDVVELCDIAETCKRTQKLAQYTFRLKHKRLNLNTIRAITLQKTMRLLRNFGSVITSLNISRKLLSPLETNKASEKLLILIGTHCGENLTELSLKNIRMTVKSMNQMEKVFGSLTSMTFEHFSFNNSDLSALNDKLEVLKINYVDFMNSFAFTPNNYKPLIDFLKTANALKHLSIVQCTRLPSLILRTIGQLTQLEELEIHLNMKTSENVIQRNLLHWFALNKLKVLKMDCQGISPQPLLEGLAANNIAIEHLELIHTMHLDYIDSVSKLKTIKILKLDGQFDFSDEHLLTIANGLKLLNELHVSSEFSPNVTQNGVLELIRKANQLSCLHIYVQDFELTMNVYNEMLRIVKNRHEYIKLTITFSNDGWKPIFDQDETLRMNNHWLEVVEIRDVPMVMPLFLIFFD